MRLCTLSMLLVALTPALAARADRVVDFEDLSLAPGSFNNGDPGTLQPGDELTTTFESRGAAFNNTFGIDRDFQYPYWSGWAVSNIVDATTPGFGNQYASYAGGGFGDFGAVDSSLLPPLVYMAAKWLGGSSWSRTARIASSVVGVGPGASISAICVSRSCSTCMRSGRGAPAAMRAFSTAIR